MIVFKVKPAYEGHPEGVFAGRFCNENTKVLAWLEIEGVGHYQWLQRPWNHLPCELQLKYISESMLQFFNFFVLY